MSRGERGSLEKLILAGIGAMALTHDKSKELIKEFVKKGEITVEQGKVINEELKRNVKTKINNEVIVPIESVAVSSIIQNLDKLSDGELAALKAKLEEVEKAGKNDDENVGE